MQQPFVITNYAETLTGWRHTITATTDQPVHLHARRDTIGPTVKPRYRVRRGVQQVCGFALHVNSPECYEQLEPGDTTTHSWSFIGTPPIPGGYIVLSTACDLLKPAQSTVPILLETNLVQPAIAIRAPLPAPLPPLATLTPTYTGLGFNNNWEPTPLPRTDLVSIATWPCFFDLFATIRATAFGTATFTITDTTTATVVASQSFPAVPTFFMSWAFVEQFTAQQNHHYQGTIRNDGPGTLLFDPDGLGPAFAIQWSLVMIVP